MTINKSLPLTGSDYRCGHNFSPDECPYPRCGYRQCQESVRDEFAMAALTGMLAREQYPNIDAVFEYADAAMAFMMTKSNK